MKPGDIALCEQLFKDMGMTKENARGGITYIMYRGFRFCMFKDGMCYFPTRFGLRREVSRFRFCRYDTPTELTPEALAEAYIRPIFRPKEMRRITSYKGDYCLEAVFMWCRSDSKDYEAFKECAQWMVKYIDDQLSPNPANGWNILSRLKAFHKVKKMALTCYDCARRFTPSWLESYTSEHDARLFTAENGTTCQVIAAGHSDGDRRSYIARFIHDPWNPNKDEYYIVRTFRKTTETVFRMYHGEISAFSRIFRMDTKPNPVRREQAASPQASPDYVNPYRGDMVRASGHLLERWADGKWIKICGLPVFTVAGIYPSLVELDGDPYDGMHLLYAVIFNGIDGRTFPTLVAADQSGKVSAMRVDAIPECISSKVDARLGKTAKESI